MANVSIDADKLITEAENIKEVAKEFNILINDMYKKFSSLDVNGVWKSSPNGSLERFLNKVNKSKTNTLSLANTLNTFGDKVITFAKSINEASDNKI